MCLSSRFMCDLGHYQRRGGPGPAGLFIMPASAKWQRLTMPEPLGVWTTSGNH
jgi:hypothetical protein